MEYAEYNSKFLFPGELFFSPEPYKITTLLGSCVSVVLFNTKYKCGGMNHYLLPDTVDVANKTDNKYGVYAINNLINQMLKVDSNISNYEAKIFGGNRVINNVGLYEYDIGGKNIALAKKMLKQFGIFISCEYVDNDFGIKIHYFNFTGRVLVAKIQNSLRTDNK